MKGSTWHVDRLLGIMDPRAELYGLDARGHSGERPLVNIDLITDDDLRDAAADLRRALAIRRAVEPRRLHSGS
jgi:hypothetical protein